jgi:hypothetical protein
MSPPVDNKMPAHNTALLHASAREKHEAVAQMNALYMTGENLEQAPTRNELEDRLR